jgi:hypothetical protein
MRISVDREEKKGLFGRSFFETSIKVFLTSEERQIATERRLINLSLIGDGNISSQDTANLLHLCNRSRLSLADLINGIVAKAEGNQLSLLGWLEEEVKNQCKIIKSNLEVVEDSYEEEI